MSERDVDSADKDGTLLVWDADGSPPVGNWTIVLWRQYAAGKKSRTISIPELVELHADELRARYLAWIYDLGEAQIAGARVIDHLGIRPGFSYWWMSSLAQKFNISGTSRIDDAIKLLALERLVVEQQSNSIVLVTGNRRLAAAVQPFCRNRSIGYAFRQGGVNQPRRDFRSVMRLLPHSWRAFIYLAWYVGKALPFLPPQRKTAATKFVGEVTFIDVLTHLDKKALATGRFISNYWTDLVGKLPDWKINSNWLHLFFRHSDIVSPAQAQHQVDRFNENSRGAQFHRLIERSLTIRVIFAAVRDYLAVRRSRTVLRGISAIQPAGSTLDLWPLHVEGWEDSLCGKEAMINCLRLSLFEAVANSLTRQRIGVYIAENQPWEMALIYAWKAAGHETLIGVPHTTVRYWDLRYHYDSRSYVKNKANDLPMPDLLAVNGPAAKDTVLRGGYPSDRVREVEALRFLYLLKPRPHSETISSVSKGLRILVCGDFLPETTRRIISWLEAAAKSLPPDSVYVFKPHPAYPLGSTDYHALKLEISEVPLGDLLADCDVVFASYITSAVVDAYCVGVPIVQMLDGSSFNTSPLRGLKGVTYAATPDELAEALSNAKRRERVKAVNYFYLDAELSRWRNLLSV
jgi:surface carbohydrate biosynthesis protein (TIGR04326 family)